MVIALFISFSHNASVRVFISCLLALYNLIFNVVTILNLGHAELHLMCRDLQMIVLIEYSDLLISCLECLIVLMIL